MSTSYATQIKRLRAQVGDLLASHEKTRDLAEFSEYADDPIGFMREVLRCDPWEKQCEMAVRVRDNSRTIVVTCNGLGKDWAVARIAIWWAYARRGMVFLTGPSDRQVKHILMRQVRQAFAAAPELPGDLYAAELRISNESGILAMTSDSADKLVGFHHPRLLICITEAQGVEEEAFEAAFACATAPENRILIYGNPVRPSGSFYRFANSENWSVLTISAFEHPNVINNRVEIPGAVSREFIQLMADEYGERSSIYRSRVLAQFPDDSIEGLIRRDWLRAAFARFESRELEKQAAQHRPVLALDVARFGPDASVLAIVQGPLVREFITWRGASITETVDKVIQAATLVRDRDLQSRRPAIYVDEPGLGGGAIDLLRAKGWEVYAFNGAREARERRRFLNKRAETHWQLRVALENNRIAIPRDVLLEEECLAAEWQIATGGQIQILSKETMRATLGRSPDRLDALVIGISQSLAPVQRAAAVSFGVI